MTTKEKRIKLALAEGFVVTKEPWSYMGESGINTHYKLWNNKGEVLYAGLRDYFGSLNEVREARRRLLVTEEQQTTFVSYLREFDFDAYRGVDECVYELINMDAAKQAEALGWTLNLWEPERLDVYDVSYYTRIILPSGKIRTVTAAEISDAYVKDWCKAHNSNPEGRFAMDMANRLPSNLRLWLESFVVENMFPESVLLVQEASPLEFEKNGGCPVCRNDEEHMHAQYQCVACRVMGSADVVRNHVCKCQK